MRVIPPPRARLLLPAQESEAPACGTCPAGAGHSAVTGAEVELVHLVSRIAPASVVVLLVVGPTREIGYFMAGSCGLLAASACFLWTKVVRHSYRSG